MAECRQLAAWAESLSSKPVGASDGYITNRLQFMQAALPARAIDDSAGEKRAAVYLSILRGHSREALTFLSDEACRRCDWFPTPKQCLEIIAEHRPPVSERDATLRLCAAFAEDALAAWLANLEAGEEIGDVPEQWIRIAIERGPLRRLSDGKVVSRALYFGPSKPYGVAS